MKKEIYIKFERINDMIRYEDEGEIDSVMIALAIVRLEDLLLESIEREKNDIKDKLGYNLDVPSQKKEFMSAYIREIKELNEWEDVKYN